MADLQELLEAYDEAIGQRPSTEAWFVKRYADSFIVCRFDDASRIEIEHKRQASSDSIELVSLAEEGDPRELLDATRLIGPLRAALDGAGRLCLRGSYRSEWGPHGALAFAASVLDASIRLLREARFRSVTYAEPPLELRTASTLTVAPAPDVAPGPREVEAWLKELDLRFLQGGPNEWQVQTFGPSGVGYTSQLVAFGKILIALVYGSPNNQLVVDDDFVRTMLRHNDRSGLGKLTFVNYEEAGRKAPAATLEWPAAAINSAENFGRLVASMTDYLEGLWGDLRIFFVPDEAR